MNGFKDKDYFIGWTVVTMKGYFLQEQRQDFYLIQLFHSQVVSYYIFIKNIFIMAIAVGTKAPAFTLFNTERKQVSLSDFAGKTLVINFFPAAFTSVCTAQMCSSRDELSFYNDLGATVIGISVDMPFSLGAFKEKNKINFELLSDAGKRTIHEYEMYHCNFICDIKGVAKRGVIVIDKSGIVAYAEETATPGVQVNFPALKEALQKLK
ncbi:MAG: redoxin domain-containing protein [Bacteroidota bacterium]